MYYFAAAILAIIYIAIAVSHYFARTSKGAVKAKIFTVILSASGFLTAVVSTIIFFISISSSKNTEDYKDWAKDMFSVYLKTVLTVFVLVAAVVIVSSVIQPKLKLMRCSVTLLISLLLIISGPIFSFFSQNDKYSIDVFIKIISLSLSAAAQFSTYFDYGREINKLLSEETGKKIKTPLQKKKRK